MSVNEEFAPNRKPTFRRLEMPKQPQPPQSQQPVKLQNQNQNMFTRLETQCKHLLGPTYEGSLVNFCDLMPGIICTKNIYNDPEQYNSCEYKKIYDRPIFQKINSSEDQ